MSSERMLVLAAVAAGLAACGSVEAQRAERRPEPVRVSMVSERTGVGAGGTVHVAVAFEIEPSWHLYWNGYNDTGVAPGIEWDLPQGVEVGEIRWPAPRRYESPGGVLDHVYEDRLLLMAPLSVDEGVSAGTELEIGASVRWMVCSDVCLLGRQEVGLRLPVVDEASEARKTPAAKAFERTRRRLAKPLPASDPPVAIGRREGRLVIEVPGAARVSFYPEEGGASLADLLEEGAGRGERLVLGVSEEVRVAGVVEAEMGDGRVLIHRIEAPAPR